MGWFGQSFRIDGRSTKIKQNKRRKRKKKKSSDGLLFKCDHPEMVFFFLSPSFSLCLIFVLARGALEIKKEGGLDSLPS